MFSKSIITKVFATAAVALASASAVQAETTDTFVHAGVTYTYAQTVENGKRVIVGRTDDGQTFRLRVGDRNVTGRFNGNLVTFRLKDVTPLKIAMR